MARAQIWAERVTEWRESGLSASEFAKGRDFRAGTLRWWSSRLRREARKSEGVQLARVVRAPSISTSPRGIVVEMSGARVLVPVGVDAATLKTVFAALGSLS